MLWGIPEYTRSFNLSDFGKVFTLKINNFKSLFSNKNNHCTINDKSAGKMNMD